MEWIALALLLGVSAAVTLWMAGAIFYDVWRPHPPRTGKGPP